MPSKLSWIIWSLVDVINVYLQFVNVSNRKVEAADVKNLEGHRTKYQDKNIW